MLVVQLACVAAVERGTYFISNYLQWPVGWWFCLHICESV